ncbi:putative Acyclic terpene utilization family protein AtuA-containing protein [Homarus americanus]|uniref:Putative Acyclic terpene utilization family protein AtuA-containing protein n=1 Tax=Homarus americanus TaxID=6706 RepID=A0A8J5N7A9_HOMAM|nr:putative Acyclic terpene utilization family protein AtuA-containing protein [Homarus americanus]
MAYLGTRMVRLSPRIFTDIPLPISCRRYFAAESQQNNVRIGCASGFWGDTPTAAPQLIHNGNLDFLMFDYLSEITMSLLTAARAKRPEFGYAPDFVLFALGPYLNEIKSKGIRVLSNAGGINPEGCAMAMRQAAKKAVVTGDDLMPIKEELILSGKPDMKSGLPLPKSVHSMNAYLGAGPIARVLDEGADVVITGRCADSSLALGPLMHTFGWQPEDLDQLAAGSLAGHLIECGAQATGGTYTDWHIVPDWHNIGFPIAEVSSSGSFLITKPPNTGGLVNCGTVAEQMLYEIGDPRAYVLPDVVCDFSGVTLKEVKQGVLVSGVKGKPATDSFKVSATYLEGYKATAVCCVGGPRSREKGKKTAEAILKRCQNIFKLLKIKDFTRTHIQVLGGEDTYGPHASLDDGPREGVIWMSVHHSDKKALELFSREIAAAGTGMAPGLTSIVGGRPKPSPLLHLHSFLVKKDICKVNISVDGKAEAYSEASDSWVPSSTYDYADQPISHVSDLATGSKNYRLEDLALTRSGDKANSCNVGVIARHPALYPYLKQALTSLTVASYFSHVFPADLNPVDCVKRYEVDGICGLNFILENSLGGGGVASLRSDPQGKAYGQMLLDFVVRDMPDMATLTQN